MFFLVLLLTATAAQAQEGTTHTVRPGDTLFSISRLYDVPVDSIRVWNDMAGNDIRAGMELRVRRAATPTAEPPATPRTPAAPEPDPVPAEPKPASNTVPDQLFGIPLDSLKTWNPGYQTYLDSLAAAGTVPVRGQATYAVKAGDTLFGVARAHGTDVATLRRLNALTDSGLRVGQELRVPSRGIVESRVAQWPATLSGRRLADGTVYHPDRQVVGHPEWPLGSVVFLDAGGPVLLAVVADRSPSMGFPVLDLSKGLVDRLGLELHPAAVVRVRMVPQ
ncbi:MAG: LysM peptidoglycan-binding domain-containing protein [Rhodothermales bacterium]